MAINETTRWDDLVACLQEMKTIKTQESDENIYQWLIFLVLLYSFSKNSNEIHALWNEFTEDVLYNNRYFPKKEILNELYSIVKDNTCSIPIGTILFRARNYPKSSLLEEIEKLNPFNEETVDLEKIKHTITSCHDSKIWGFDAKNSGAPSREKVSEGRANPMGIPYLYLAEDKETAITEIRPFLNSFISVATFETKEKLFLIDLSQSDKKSHLELNEKQKIILKVFSTIYSELNSDNKRAYIPTQIFSEFLKLEGFDGIRFTSSLHEGGINIVLFNNKACKFVASDVYQLQKINYEINKIFPPEEENIPILLNFLNNNPED